MADKNVTALSFKVNNGKCERIVDGETKVQRGPAGKTVMLCGAGVLAVTLESTLAN
jgi:hypothetical protein